MDNIIKYLQENREKLTLVGYFGLILVLAWPITNMLAEAWEVSLSDRGLTNALIRFLRFVVFAAILDSSHQTLTAMVFGLYVGLLVLMTIDPKKRWQAFLLWIGTVVALIVLQSVGLVLPQLDLVSHAPAIIAGLALGLFIGGGRQIVELLDGETIEFRQASQALFFMLFAFIVLSLIEVHLTYPGLYVPSDEPFNPTVIENSFGLNGDGLLLNVILAGVFLVTMKRFVQYDSDANFFILGPRASGKSLFLIGAYLEALKRARSAKKTTPLEPSEDLMEILEALDRQETEWIVEATSQGEVNNLSFQYVHGSVFPTNIRLSALDYAGEYLLRLPDALSGALDEDNMDNVTRRLVDGVNEADTLILTIDLDRFASNEPLDISEYFSILQATDSKDELLVATKADVMVEDFEEERGLEAHLYYDEFTEFVNTRLKQNENIEALVTETSEDIHPVYYQTKMDESGERVPMRDDTGSVMTVGFDELLNKLGRT